MNQNQQPQLKLVSNDEIKIRGPKPDELFAITKDWMKETGVEETFTPEEFLKTFNSEVRTKWDQTIGETLRQEELARRAELEKAEKEGGQKAAADRVREILREKLGIKPIESKQELEKLIRQKTGLSEEKTSTISVSNQPKNPEGAQKRFIAIADFIGLIMLIPHFVWDRRDYALVVKAHLHGCIKRTRSVCQYSYFHEGERVWNWKDDFAKDEGLKKLFANRIELLERMLTGIHWILREVYSTDFDVMSKSDKEKPENRASSEIFREVNEILRGEAYSDFTGLQQLPRIETAQEKAARARAEELAAAREYFAELEFADGLVGELTRAYEKEGGQKAAFAVVAKRRADTAGKVRDPSKRQEALALAQDLAARGEVEEAEIDKIFAESRKVSEEEAERNSRTTVRSYNYGEMKGAGGGKKKISGKKPKRNSGNKKGNQSGGGKRRH